MQAQTTLFELVGTRAFDLGLLRRLGGRGVERLPFRLPRLHRLFGSQACLACPLLTTACRDQVGICPGQSLFEFDDAFAVVVEVALQLATRAGHFLGFTHLTSLEFAGVLN